METVTTLTNEQQVAATTQASHTFGRGARQLATPLEFRLVIERIKRDYPLIDCLGRFGVRMRRQGQWWVGNCPFPNHADKSPSFKVRIGNPERFACFGCNAKGDAFDLVRDLYGCASLAEQVEYLTNRTLGSWLRDESGGGESSSSGYTASAKSRRYAASPTTAAAAAGAGATTRKESAAAKPDVVTTSAEAEEADLYRSQPDEVTGPVYERLLGMWSLSGAHRAEIERRGLRAAHAFALGYRTFPSNRGERIKTCDRLVREGFALERVPGFFRLPDEPHRWCIGGNPWGWRDVSCKVSRESGTGESGTGEEEEKEESGRRRRRWQVAGLVVPVCDEEGRITGLKLRNSPAPVDLPENLADVWPAKYMALGSGGRTGGASPPVKAHFAGSFDGGNAPGVLWVTEGEIKADIAAHYLGCRVCGLPGVGQLPNLAIGAAVRGGFREIRIAMDAENKNHVQLAIRKLWTEGEAQGLKVSIAIWDGAQGKGIDDLLAAGGMGEVIEPEVWWRSLSCEAREYVERREGGRCVG